MCNARARTPHTRGTKTIVVVLVGRGGEVTARSRVHKYIYILLEYFILTITRGFRMFVCFSDPLKLLLPLLMINPCFEIESPLQRKKIHVHFDDSISCRFRRTPCSHGWALTCLRLKSQVIIARVPQIGRNDVGDV